MEERYRLPMVLMPAEMAAVAMVVAAMVMGAPALGSAVVEGMVEVVKAVKWLNGSSAFHPQGPPVPECQMHA